MTKNIDQQETSHFAKMADDWWNPTGSSRPLHEINPVRMQFITDRCEVVNKKMLDVGCGAGILTESLAKRKALVTGIDATEKLIVVAKNHSTTAGQENSNPIQYYYTTAEEFAEKHAGEFDIISCMELLEHVPDPESLIAACRKLIKPNGDLFFSTLNRNPKSYFMAIVGAEYLLKILPKNTHHYAKFIRPSELEQALRKVDLKLEDIAGLHYNPFSHQVKLTEDVSVNYIIHAKTNF
jgi:2-polyprenyl-6-hydroxyphenyl methylase/3-demethylubiquinone-9 3-methyltransferase